MALTSAQQSSKLFKALMGVGETHPTLKEFFEEPYSGRPIVLLDQLWAESDKIPTTAPTLGDGETSGVVKKYARLSLSAIPGVSNAFYNANLKNCIPFNFGDGSYNYVLEDANNNAISFGEYNWIIDPGSGVLTFYGTGGAPAVPTGKTMPPKVTFFQYVGATGMAGLQHTEEFDLSSTDITNRYVLLSSTPKVAGDVLLVVAGAPTQLYGIDFVMDDTNTKMLKWTGLGLEALLEEGDDITVIYSS